MRRTLIRTTYPVLALVAMTLTLPGMMLAQDADFDALILAYQ